MVHSLAALGDRADRNLCISYGSMHALVLLALHILIAENLCRRPPAARPWLVSFRHVTAPCLPPACVPCR